MMLSQTKEQREVISKNSNVEELLKLSKEFNADYLARKERVSKFVSKSRLASRAVSKKGVVSEIYDILPNGEIEYYSTQNLGLSSTSRANRLYSGGSLGLNVQGQGMTAYVWDAGSPRTTHSEFPNQKVVSADGAISDDHGGHVMGSIVAQGINPSLRGVAFDASGVSYDWNNDFAEMTYEAANGMLVSNHSYTRSPSGQATPWHFGAYDSASSSIDLIMSNAPYYLVVAAAGNDRNDFNDPFIGPYLGEKGGYNLIKGMQNAKNILTVGAVNNVSNYTSKSSVVMAPFSSWGPTDDGRIKPDIVTKGVNVRSTDVTSDTANYVSQGTSMASPGIAGVAILLQQYFYSLNTNYMRAATLKGIMLHTADETGDELGPDYKFGWGLVNAENAASIIKSKTENSAILSELQLNNGQTYSTQLAVTSNSPLMVSISWTDPASAANTTRLLDPTTLYLKNDLDLRITKDGETFFPWTLDPSNPDFPAVRNSDNFRDNFEKVQIDNPNGVYTIKVTHKGTLQGQGNTQKFSLIASSLSSEGVTLSNDKFVLDESQIFLYPNPTNNILNYSFSNDIVLKNIVVSDVSGKQIFTNNTDLSVKQIDVSDLSSGIYFVTFYAEEGSFTKKFVKN